jgi:hypothetical protein
MPVETVQTLTPQMRRILMTTHQRHGTASFLVCDINERSVQTLERRGLVTYEAIRERLWRPSMQRKDSAVDGPVMEFIVTLTPLGQKTVSRISRW